MKQNTLDFLKSSKLRFNFSHLSKIIVGENWNTHLLIFIT